MRIKFRDGGRQECLVWRMNSSNPWKLIISDFPQWQIISKIVTTKCKTWHIEGTTSQSHVQNTLRQKRNGKRICVCQRRSCSLQTFDGKVGWITNWSNWRFPLKMQKICLFLECKFDKEIVMGSSKVPNRKKCSFWSKDNRTPINSFLWKRTIVFH